MIKAIVRQLLTAVGLLRAGNIFLKFSADGPPHDRLVWVSDDMRTLLWCNPEKNRTHDLKPDARMDVREVAAVTEGIKTEVFKKAVKKSEGGGVIGKMTMMNSLQKKPSQVLKGILNPHKEQLKAAAAKEAGLLPEGEAAGAADASAGGTNEDDATP